MPSSMVRTAILGLTAEQARQLHQWLQRWVQPVLVRQDLRDAVTQLIVVRPQAVLLYVGDSAATALTFCRRLRMEMPDVALVILAEREDHALTREAIHMGAKALVVLGTDDDQDLAKAFQAIAEEHTDAQALGHIGVVTGAKGGVGATASALNIAAWLCMDPNQRVALVDLSPQVGEHGLYLSIDSPTPLRQLTRDIHTVDDEWFAQHGQRHSAGFHLFSQPLAWTRNHSSLSVPEVPAALGALSRYFTAIVVDAGLSSSDLALAAIAAGNRTAVFSSAEAPSLLAGRRLLALLRGFGHEAARLLPVVNLTSADQSTNAGNIQGLLGMDPALMLRYDPVVARGSLESGQLAVRAHPGAGLTQDYAALTALMFPEFQPYMGPQQQQQKKKRLFGLF